MFYSRRERENIDNRTEISWQQAIIMISVILFVAVPLGWLLGWWSWPWVHRSLTALVNWIFG